jgi:hypothetical protein
MKGFMPDGASAVPIVVRRVACHKEVLLVAIWHCVREDSPVPNRHFILAPSFSCHTFLLYWYSSRMVLPAFSRVY